ncbi:MAG: YceI family protein [Alphaproteobacteria bacterium]
MNNLKAMILSAGGAMAVAGLILPANAAEQFLVDPAHASVLFSVSHLGFSHTYGRFNTVEGAITLDAEAPEKSSVVVSIDAASLDTNHAKRDEHLRGKDFFDVTQFPTLKYKSTSVTVTGDKKATVIGDLTMHGVTKSVPLEVTLINSGPHPMDKTKTLAGISARGTLKRTEFGMGYAAPLLGDEVELIIEVDAIRQP